MASQYVTENGTLIIPGPYSSAKVEASSGILGTNGVLFLVGEADQGPAFSEEADLSVNFFGPDQKSDIIAKYASGRIVDAFCGAASASNDVQIQGSFSGAYILKTNTSGVARTTLPAIGGGTYGYLTASAAGGDGNLITRTITATDEVRPSTGNTVICSPPVNTNVTVRVNGGAATTVSLTAGMTPAQIATAFDAVTGVTPSTTIARNVINVSRVITVALTGGGAYNASFTSTVAWNTTPNAGDILMLPTDVGGFNVNSEGTYVVTSATSTIIYATKLMDGATATLTPPVPEASLTITPTAFECYPPISINMDPSSPLAILSGTGKSLEIANTSTGDFASLCYTFNGDTVAPSLADWVSTTASPTCVVSSQEYQVHLNTARQKGQINETIDIGEGPVLSLGYVGTTASATIANGVMTLTLVGGASSALSPIVINLADRPTVRNLCDYIGSLSGFTASPTLETYSSILSTRLDPGTYSFGSSTGAMTGRIKTDGYDFQSYVNSQSVLVGVTPAGTATVLTGLPDVASLGFLNGGTKGSTDNAAIQAAFDRMKGLKGNFVIPLFSQDASLDVAAGLTDASSAYTIASINSMARSHCLQMSGFKTKKWRRAICSFKGTFAQAKNAAGNFANAIGNMTFQDVIDTNFQGTLTTFQPWMAAVKAASMQAGGFYKDITWKYIQISGASCVGYDPDLDSNVEGALYAGLLPITKDNGGFKWVSDQTTYSMDDNFVYNSLQAGYAVDLIQATTVERMGRAFVGQSLADVSASTGVTVFKAIMADLAGLKLIAGDDSAPSGVKNIVVKIRNGNAMLVSAEVKLATAIKFVVISFLVQAISQTATG
jgi:hypothetical protein